MDPVTLQRIKFLHPKVRNEVLEAYKNINTILLGKNIRLRFTHTLRSIDEQNQLFARGRSMLFDTNGNRFKKVTNAKGGESIHNYGLAFDIVLLVDKDRNGSFESVSWDTKADMDNNNKPDWMEVVDYLRQLGWTWGGNWRSFPDYPHFEKTFGYNWKTLLQKYNNGEVSMENIDGKIYKWVNL